MSVSRIPLLLYHSVADGVDPRFAEWAVSPELFGAHLELLAGEGYRTFTVSELVDQVFRGDRTPERAVAITFDDGFEDFYTAAWERLRRHRMSATVFVTTGCVGATSTWLRRQGEGDRPLMSWAQLAQIAAAGVECGAHGHTHAQLDTLPLTRAREEIELSKLDLEANVGPVASFAYPHGYSSRRLRRAVRRAGFAQACGVRDGLASAADDPYAITRAVVRGATSVEELGRILEGDRPDPAPQPLRRVAWRGLRRAGAEPLAERLSGRSA